MAAWRVVSKKACGVINKIKIRPRTQKQPQVKKEPCRVLDVDVDVDYVDVKLAGKVDLPLTSLCSRRRIDTEKAIRRN